MSVNEKLRVFCDPQLFEYTRPLRRDRIVRLFYSSLLVLRQMPCFSASLIRSSR